MASGVQVAPTVLVEYENIKLKHQYKFIIFKITDDLKSIDVERTSTDEDYAAFVGALPEAECRWAVYDLAFEKDGGKRTKLAFVMWSPDDAKIKNKMLYASSKDALRRSLDGIAVEIQGTSYDEVTYESLVEKANRR